MIFEVVVKWKLFLDDIRNPKTADNWKIARNSDEAFYLIKEYGCPEHISFDHDLGCDIYGSLLPTAYDFTKQFADKILDGDIVLPENFTFYVHSANPVGAKNIENYMNNLLKHLRKQ